MVAALTTPVTAAAIAGMSEALGIDATALLWGMAGGCVWLTSPEQTGVSARRAVLSIMASAVVAGAIAPILSFYIGQTITGLPTLPAKVCASLLVGAGAQKLMPFLIEAMPRVATWVAEQISRVFGGGRNG
jgi:hypothetical protein